VIACLLFWENIFPAPISVLMETIGLGIDSYLLTDGLCVTRCSPNWRLYCAELFDMICHYQFNSGHF
jgi:hypothetical protein